MNAQAALLDPLTVAEIEFQRKYEQYKNALHQWEQAIVQCDEPKRRALERKLMELALDDERIPLLVM